MAQGRGRGWVRVIAGSCRGLRLATLPGLEVRPTSDRVRESLFGILGPRLAGARVADCFAGTGALGIEAISRGAARAVFVERDGRALAVLRENLGRLPDPALARVVPGDALQVAAWRDEAFPADLVFADPPYRKGIGREFLAALAGADVLAPEGVVILEHERGGGPEAAFWVAIDRRRYGDTEITLYTRRNTAGEGWRAP